MPKYSDGSEVSQNFLVKVIRSLLTSGPSLVYFIQVYVPEYLELILTHPAALFIQDFGSSAAGCQQQTPNL